MFNQISFLHVFLNHKFDVKWSLKVSLSVGAYC